MELQASAALQTLAAVKKQQQGKSAKAAARTEEARDEAAEEEEQMEEAAAEEASAASGTAYDTADTEAVEAAGTGKLAATALSMALSIQLSSLT